MQVEIFFYRRNVFVSKGGLDYDLRILCRSIYESDSFGGSIAFRRTANMSGLELSLKVT